MLNVANKPVMLSVIMLNSIMLSVIMLNSIMLSVVLLNVVAPFGTPTRKQSFHMKKDRAKLEFHANFQSTKNEHPILGSLK
jgi:hypothetical protein